MTDEHFSRDAIERFLHLKTRRDETRRVVRHLLRRCPECAHRVREVTQRQDFRYLLEALEDIAMAHGPETYAPRHGRVAYAVARQGTRSWQGHDRPAG